MPGYLCDNLLIEENHLQLLYMLLLHGVLLYKDRVVGHNRMAEHSTQQYHDDYFIVTCVGGLQHTVATYF